MASSLKNLSQYSEDTIPSAENMTFGIVVSDWNTAITHSLYQACFDTLIKHGAKKENIVTEQVPGTFELPVGAKIMASSEKMDVVICLGCVIKGETSHNEYINQAVATGLVQLGVLHNKPFIFGVLTPNDEQQAKDRAGGKYGNKGVEAATSAIRMAALKMKYGKTKQKIGFS